MLFNLITVLSLFDLCYGEVNCIKGLRLNYIWVCMTPHSSVTGPQRFHKRGTRDHLFTRRGIVLP
jgi:hypothetical protein